MLPSRHEDSDIIYRPRVNLLLEQGLQHPLLLVVAGTGYGKTHAVAHLAQTVDARVVWLQANSISNYAERFWRMLKEAFQASMPALAARLGKFDFPKTYAEQDNFLRLLSDAAHAGKPVLLILDDLQAIHNAQIQQFLYTLLEAGIENLRMIAISNAKEHTYLRPGMIQGTPYRVTAQDLAFTDEEIGLLLAQNDIPASDAAVALARKVTDGWPVALQALITHWQDEKNLLQQVPLSMDAFMDMFYLRHYNQYDPDVKLMLVKLALLPLFTLEIAAEIGGCDPLALVDVLQSTPFVISDHTHGAYTFQVVYRTFLSSLFLLEEAEQRRVRYIAATHYRQGDRPLEGIGCFIAAQAYDEAFEIMCLYPHERITYDIADAFIEHIATLPEAYVAGHPHVSILCARLNTYFGRMDEALDALQALLPRHADTPEVAGEIYLAIGEIIAERRMDEAIPYYEKARECLPEGSAMRLPRAMYIINRSMVKIRDAQAGTMRERLADAQRLAGLTAHLYRRTSESWYELSAAEVAYYQLDLETARDMAYKAVYSAALSAQHDIQCNAWFVLLRIELMHGNLAEATAFAGKIETLIHEKELYSLLVLRDCIFGWFHLRIHDLSGVPRWLTDIGVDRLTYLYPSSERDIILRVLYKLEMGAHSQALAMIDALMPYCEARLFGMVQLYLYIAKAVIHARLSNADEAIAALREAYVLTYDNGIVAPFIETGHHMRALISLVNRTEDHGFDEGWLATVSTKASSYAKRISNMTRAREGRRAERAPWPGPALTLRETEVLGHLTKGLKYEEISDLMGISINGVKKHITSIYNKLGAVNRADAIYIAMTEGIIS